MGLRPGGRFRRVRGCGVDWYAGIRGGGAGLDWETCENGNSGNWWMRCSVMGMAGAWSRISILTRSRDLPRRRRCLRGAAARGMERAVRPYGRSRSPALGLRSQRASDAGPLTRHAERVISNRCSSIGV